MEDIETCGAANLNHYLDAIKQRIDALPELPEDSHRKSEAALTPSYELVRVKGHAMDCVEEIKALFKLYLSKDNPDYD